MGFLQSRLSEQKKLFDEKYYNASDCTKFSGLYSLLRLAQEPTASEIEDASAKYIDFINLPYDKSNPDHLMNEAYFVKVF